MMRANTCMLVLLISASVLWSAHSVAAGSDYKKLFPGNKQRHLTEAGKYRFEFDNDLFVDSDNGFSNGWAFQIHTPLAESWDEVEGPANYLKSFAKWLPTLTGDDLEYRLGFAVGQVIQTPDDLKNPNPIPNDVPYAGLLTGQLGLIAYNDEDFRGFGFVLGVVGRPSMAEQAQNFVHNLGGTAEIAQGWDNQLNTEPLINATYMRKKKFYQAGERANFSFDAGISGDAALGNLFTGAGLTLETRFGSNMPGGFSYRADPIGRYLPYDAGLAPERPKASSIYGTVEVNASAVAHNILLDGNVFRDNPPHVGGVEKESVVGHLLLGFHYQRPSWGIHLVHTISTDVAEPATVTATPDSDNTFTSIMFEWRI